MNNNPSQTQPPVALTRFKAVNHIEEQVRKGCPLAQALRTASLCPWPDEQGRCYAPRTLEDWWYAYRDGGFPALETHPRADRGTFRVIDAETGQWLIEQVCQHPDIPVKVLYGHWKGKQDKALPPIRSVYRYLQRHGYDRTTLMAGPPHSGPTKAFEAPHVNDLWMVDFSPGPKLGQEPQRISPQLCVIVDDCSRLIPFAAYYLKADTEAFLQTLKEAVLRRGVPLKLYTDQGKPFVNQHAAIVCANLGIRLLHAKPYHSWSKGKCERLIQTIQKGFESALHLAGNEARSLEELNTRLSHWIQTVYHLRVHSATGLAPERRYQQQLQQVRKLDTDPFGLEHLFYTRKERTVRKDGTVRIDSQLYEVDLSLRTLRVQLRYDPFTLRRIEVWHQDRFVGLARRANLQLNSQTAGDEYYEKH